MLQRQLSHLNGRKLERAKFKQSQSQSHIATDGQSVCLGVEPQLGLMTRFLLFLFFSLYESFLLLVGWD
jgi:hypothetical protein